FPRSRCSSPLHFWSRPPSRPSARQLHTLKAHGCGESSTSGQYALLYWCAVDAALNFRPQQYAATAEGVREAPQPRACGPSATCVRVPPRTSTGLRVQLILRTVHESSALARSEASAADPQQYVAPATDTAQARWSPAATARNFSDTRSRAGVAIRESRIA